MIPVVIGTHPERTAWLDDCLTSIKATSKPRRRIYVHRDGGYESAALRAGAARFKRFLFLHDSVTILHADFWTTVDASGPAWLAGPPHMQLGIYDSATVLPLLPTHDLTKTESIYWESHLPTLLPAQPMLWPDVTDATALRHDQRHGRENKVLGNHLWTKHKGHWGQTT